MPNLTDFTSYAEIRAVLGVAPEELEDETLALPLYVRSLVFDLTDLAFDMDTQYETVLALPSTSWTAAQKRYYECVQLFSAYSVSKQLLGSLPLFSPQTIKDGRAEFDRQDDPFADVKAGVLDGLNLARKRLLAAYAGLTAAPAPTLAITALFSVSAGLPVDPVTGA